MVRVLAKRGGDEIAAAQFLYDCETTVPVGKIAVDLVEIVNLQLRIRCLSLRLQPLVSLHADSLVTPLARALSEAMAYASNDQVLHGRPLSIYVLKDHVQRIERELDGISRRLGDACSRLSQLNAGFDFLEEDTTQLLWTGKELLRSKQLCDYIGRNEKQKIMVSLQSPVGFSIS